MNERFKADIFERLEQGSEARLAQIESAKGIGDEEILVLDDPQTTLFSKLKENFGRILKPVRGRVAVPVGMVVLTIAAACSGGGKDKPGAVNSEDFSDNLPIELFDACREYTQAETLGDAHDRTGFALSVQYLQEHPGDYKALYLASAGSLFLSGFEDAHLGFTKVQEGGLPEMQNEIAREIVEGLETFLSSEGDVLDDPEQLDKALNALFEPMGKIKKDFENNICPSIAERPVNTDDEQSVEDRYAYRDLLDKLLTDGGSGYSVPIASLLESYDYQHIADVQEVTQAIKNAVLTLDETNSTQTEFLINYAITIPAKYMAENYQLGVVTDTLNGAQVLLDVLQDEDYPLITFQLAPVGIRNRLIYFLGDEKGEQIFSELGEVILFNLETAQGQQLWNRLTPEDRLLIEP